MVCLWLLTLLALYGTVFAVDLQHSVEVLTRQLMMQSFASEERIRSDGYSGIRQTRVRREGTRPYYGESHTSDNVASIHDHANNIRTVGMGEFVAVLNGVDFRTRHNDYGLYMPSTTSGEYHKTEPVPFPDVPPAVALAPDVESQIAEMREWFKAWRDQDTKVRDYRPYFKPVLCYLEGAWSTNTETLEEPFTSDRHFVDASSWFDLQDKIRFTAYTGSKDVQENYSYLPITIISIMNNSIPVLAQWNYRILCHPLKDDLPLDRLRIIDELAPRMSSGNTYEQHALGRAARFQLNPADRMKWKEGQSKCGFLDELMGQIPGKDNYMGQINDTAFGAITYKYKEENGTKVLLNAARYHRWYGTSSNGAMGRSRHHRGFADETLFLAMTTHPEIAGMAQHTCDKEGNCVEVFQRWSAAIPLEIIYLTPLSKWNPYDLQYLDGKGMNKKTDGNRVGGLTADTAFNGTRPKIFFQTPSSFYSGEEISVDSADTTKGAVGVLDPSGDVRSVRGSGTRIMIPDIPGVGMLRQRYPIMPIHGHGSGVWKELEALKDIVLKPATYAYMYRESVASTNMSAPSVTPSSGPGSDVSPSLTLVTGMSKSAIPANLHFHLIHLDAYQVTKSSITVTSEVANGHSHDLLIKRGRRFYKIRKCDGLKACRDGHPRRLTKG